MVSAKEVKRTGWYSVPKWGWRQVHASSWHLKLARFSQEEAGDFLTPFVSFTIAGGGWRPFYLVITCSQPFKTIIALYLFQWAANAVNNDVPFSPCVCSSGFIPIPVDVTIPVDPSAPESLNSTDTFRLRTTFDVFGVLCEPVNTKSQTSHAVQLLLHGFTYNAQYWDVTWGGFQNYSYTAYSCTRGISSFSYDNLGSGRTIRPADSKLCQLPVAAQIASSISRDLQSGRIRQILTGKEKKYNKVVAIGHSLGSGIFNYAVIKEGIQAPFAGLILTGLNHDPLFLVEPPVPSLPASEVNPSRWETLDPGYVTTVNITGRSSFYGPTGSFSPTILELDEITKDVGSGWMAIQAPFIFKVARGFKAPVVELVGAMDKIFCLGSDFPCDQSKLQASEAKYFPDSRNFTMVVVDGGHDINFGFAAADEFAIMNQLFQDFVR